MRWLGSLAIFIIVLIVLKFVFGWPISILGSVVITVILTGVFSLIGLEQDSRSCKLKCRGPLPLLAVSFLNQFLKLLAFRARQLNHIDLFHQIHPWIREDLPENR